MHMIFELNTMKYTKLILTLTLAMMASSWVLSEEVEHSDRLESLNRSAFVFNETLDNIFLKPAAKVYKAAVPNPLEKGIVNVFSNLNEITNVFNDLLQGKFAQAGNDSGRFLINTTVGVGGLFDVAQRAGLDKSEGEDFGQTLAVWGVGSGPYLMLPLVGPSTLRDAPSKFFDSFANPLGYMDHVSTRNSMRGLDLLAMRADLLALDDVISGDRYLFVRDVYLQRREYLVSDGAIEDDFGDLDDY
ncbi:VacJ family lipoprotein [Porticoccaceae bacterium]|nr:VacJ family lipoprotein [Porticoccaceae bacterium]MDB9999321.1 VacJ family lipoprotein [Porticoccaceae bacterium]